MLKRKQLFCATAVAVLIGATATAWGAAGNTLVIGVHHRSEVGQRLRVTFRGADTSPPNVVGTFVAAVLEPPLAHRGSRCRHDLGSTEQNHPASKELFFQKLLDQRHTGRYSVSRLMPAFTVPGRWTICAWQFNNDGQTSTDIPASSAQVHIQVRRRGF